MKKNKIIYLFILSVVLTTSCSQMAYNKINTTIYETRKQDVDKGALPYNPVIADLKVDLDKKITGSSIRQVNKFSDNEIGVTKEASMYNAITNSGADVLIDPIYKINISNNNGKDDKVTIQSDVSGFFGKYTSIHKADANELINASYDSNFSVSQSATTSVKPSVMPDIPDPAAEAAKLAAKKKRKRKAIGWTVGSLLILGVSLGLGLGLNGLSGY